MKQFHMRAQDSISRRLLRNISCLYISIAILLIGLQLCVEYVHVKNDVIKEMENLHTSFYSSLNEALWRFDDNQLKSLLKGIWENQIIIGVSIENHHQEGQIKTLGWGMDVQGAYHRLSTENVKTFPLLTDQQVGELIVHEFPFIYTDEYGQKHQLGTGKFYSSNRIVFQQLKSSFIIILTHSVLTIFALWVIFRIVVGRLLIRPLIDLTKHVAQIDPERADNVDFSIKTIGRNELKILEEVFLNLMRNLSSARQKIENYSQHLEELVDKRTAELEQAEAELKMNEARLESLLRIAQLRETAIQAILDFALEEAIQLTHSEIGYIYHYDEAKRRFTLNSWSKAVMPQCQITKPQTAYELDHTGLWGEAVRQGRPIIVNDFSAPNPYKKGYPEGHAPLRRFLTAPVIAEGRIVAVIAVANKAEEYNDFDTRQLILLMDSVWNISQRKLAELALRQSEENYRAIFDSANDAIFIQKPDEGIIENVNQKMLEMYGYPNKDEVVGASIASLSAEVQSFTKTKAEEKDRKVVTSGPQVFDWYARRKDGTMFWVEVNLKQVIIGGEEKLLAIVRDITERRKAEDALKEAKDAAEAANRAKSQFLANMSHELRSPLNSILGYAQILNRDPHLTDHQHQAINTIFHSGEHLLEMINEALDMAKIEAGKLELNPTTFDLRATLRFINDMTRVRAWQKGLEYLYEESDLLPDLICADEKRIRQILLNLLGNAIKFSSRGQILFRVRCATVNEVENNDTLTAQLVFEVADNGIGIPEAELEKIFLPFEQASNNRQQTEGTGLGLAISRNFARIIGGDITVESEMGKGSVFRLEIQVKVVTKTTNANIRERGHVVAPEMNQPDGKRQSKDERKALIPEMLTALPPELLAELEQAAVEGDSDHTEFVVEEIRTHNALLAEALGALVADFEYRVILTNIQILKERK